MLKAERIIARDGRVVFRCRLCGHIFVDSKKYARHLIKSHLRNTAMNKRKKKKMKKILEKIDEKIKKGEKLTRFEKYLYLKVKLNNVKL